MLLRVRPRLSALRPGSSKLTISVTNNVSEKTVAEIGVDVRMCKDCRHTVFGRSDFAASLAQKPPDVKAYENLVQFEHGIRLMLPKFQRLLMILQ